MVEASLGWHDSNGLTDHQHFFSHDQSGGMAMDANLLLPSISAAARRHHQAVLAAATTPIPGKPMSALPTGLLDLDMPRSALKAKLDWVHTFAEDMRDTELWYQLWRFRRRHARAEAFGLGGLLGGVALVGASSVRSLCSASDDSEAAKIAAAVEARRSRERLHAKISGPSSGRKPFQVRTQGRPPKLRLHHHSEAVVRPPGGAPCSEASTHPSALDMSPCSFQSNDRSFSTKLRAEVKPARKKRSSEARALARSRGLQLSRNDDDSNDEWSACSFESLSAGGSESSTCA